MKRYYIYARRPSGEILYYVNSATQGPVMVPAALSLAYRFEGKAQALRMSRLLGAQFKGLVFHLAELPVPAPSNEDEETRRGYAIADALNLQWGTIAPDGSRYDSPRVKTEWGSKTAIGLFRMLKRLVETGE